MADDRRAVSIAITHALTFGITAVLVAALLFSAGQYLADQERHVADNRVSDIGSDVVSHVNSFDRLNETGRDVEASIEPDYPDRIVGNSYTISIARDDQNVFPGVEYVIEIQASIRHDPHRYPLRNQTAVDVGASMTGDQAIICLKDDLITLGSECE